VSSRTTARRTRRVMRYLCRRSDAWIAARSFPNHLLPAIRGFEDKPDGPCFTYCVVGSRDAHLPGTHQRREGRMFASWSREKVTEPVAISRAVEGRCTSASITALRHDEEGRAPCGVRADRMVDSAENADSGRHLHGEIVDPPDGPFRPRGARCYRRRQLAALVQQIDDVGAGSFERQEWIQHRGMPVLWSDGSRASRDGSWSQAS